MFLIIYDNIHDAPLTMAKLTSTERDALLLLQPTALSLRVFKIKEDTRYNTAQQGHIVHQFERSSRTRPVYRIKRFSDLKLQTK